jgi:PAS domain-containing protein
VTRNAASGPAASRRAPRRAINEPDDREKLQYWNTHILQPAQPRPLDWDTAHLRAAIDAAGVGLWWWNVETDEIALDERSLALWDLDGHNVATFSDLSAKIHPRDLDRVRAAFASTRAIEGPYEIDFRILTGDDIRWISTRGQGNDADIRHAAEHP